MHDFPPDDRIARMHAGKHPARAAVMVVLLGTLVSAAAAPLPCRIEVVEQGSGWPVPMVELRTNHQTRFVTDNAGVIAFDLPELMGRETWFDVIGHGYEVERDGFGYRGVRLTPQAGKTLRVEVRRTMPARRLGRLTGAGVFGESQKLGSHTDWPESGVLGCDSVQNTVHRGRMFWLWGDTTLAHYPLGIFHSSSATSAVQPVATFEPPLRLALEYFRDDAGRVREVARMPGDGPTWLTGYVSLPDSGGSPRLVASYSKITPPLDAYEWGLCVWDDLDAVFKPLRSVWKRSAESAEPPPFPKGHPVFMTDEEGRKWVLFGDPFPTLRCPASFEAWQNPGTWEVLTAPASVKSADGGSVEPHTGSIAWNPWRGRWVCVFMQKFGKPSAFGELWYGEADAPTGPWGPAVKVLSHENYTFYNPRLHPEFTPPDSPILVFEGTYTTMFADRPAATPRYDYNQILYRLDLDDPALAAARGDAVNVPPPASE
jgi:hypothetical protein